ncbi:unnamed protein product, partial [Rotaria sp. Silwood1]
MYKTLIDRPTFIYDRLSNLIYSFTKHLTIFCSFFMTQLNYTNDECEHLLNNIVIDFNQIPNISSYLFQDFKENFYLLLKTSFKSEEFFNVRQLIDN